MVLVESLSQGGARSPKLSLPEVVLALNSASLSEANSITSGRSNALCGSALGVSTFVGPGHPLIL